MPKSDPRIIKDTEFLKKARTRFQAADEAETEQCQRENDDIAFEDGAQWPAEIELARKGQQPVNGMPAVPARPTLVIDKVKEPVRQILNQERQADIGVELVPADDFGDLGITPDETEVTLREGLIRRIQRESSAADARTWAFKRAVIAGRGYYMVMTRYLPGKSWDQEIYTHKIYNQSGVKLDPSHEAPDGSDSDWGFVGSWLPWERFKAEQPQDAEGNDNPFKAYDDKDFMGMCEQYPLWWKSKDDEQAVRIVDYWYVERKPRQLALLEDGSSEWYDELPEGAVVAKDEDGADEVRFVIEKKVKFVKIAGGVVELERTDWPGSTIPIIKVIGDEVLPYDEQRRYSGIIRPARGAQQGFNYMISKFVEQVGLTPIPTLAVDMDAIDGYKPWYEVANTRTLPYLPYRSTGDNGQPLPGPTRVQGDPNVQPMAMGLQIFDGLIKSTTAVPDSTLGNVDPSLKSGKAIQAVVANAQNSTSNFLDNLSRSIRYEGQIINDLLYPIYGQKPNRLVRILTGEGENETMMVADPEAAPAAPQAPMPGQPMGQPGQPPQAPQMTPQQSMRQKAQKVAKLTKDAHFNCIVKVTKSWDSRRAEESSTLGQLIAGEPQMMTWFGDLYFKNSDIPARQQLADRAKLMLAPPIQAMLAKQEEGGTFDPQSQQQIAQLTQQLQQLQQQAQQMNQALQTKQVESQAQMQTAQMKAQSDGQIKQMEFQRDIELQRMKDATSIRVAEINAETKGLITGHELQHEAMALASEQQHEIGMASVNQAHSQDMAQQGAEQQAQSQMSDQQHAAEMAEMQQAAEQPEPGEVGEVGEQEPM